MKSCTTGGPVEDATATTAALVAFRMSGRGRPSGSTNDGSTGTEESARRPASPCHQGWRQPQPAGQGQGATFPGPRSTLRALQVPAWTCGFAYLVQLMPLVLLYCAWEWHLRPVPDYPDAAMDRQNTKPRSARKGPLSRPWSHCAALRQQSLNVRKPLFQNQDCMGREMHGPSILLNVCHHSPTPDSGSFPNSR